MWDVISRHRGRMCTPVQLALNTETLSEEKTPHIRQEIVDNLSAGMSPIPGGPTREESIMGLEICMGELERRAAGRLCVPDPELLAMSKDHRKAQRDGEGEELELAAVAQLEAAKEARRERKREMRVTNIAKVAQLSRDNCGRRMP